MQIITIDAPSTLGVTTKGIDQAPQAMKSAGLLERLGAQDGGSISVPAYDVKRDQETLLLNPRGIREVALSLAKAVGGVLDQGSFPLVLGGDCSILLGCVLALRRRGRYGLLFLDGHEDFYTPRTSPNGEVADMDLALVTGRGPKILADIDGLSPFVGDDDVVAFGFRDEAQARSNGSPVISQTICCYNLQRCYELSIDVAVAKALRHLEKVPSGFWIHFDVDVLDNDRMPAADNDIPGGLTFEEATRILRMVFAPGRAVGMDVTIFNPTLDPGGNLVRSVVNVLVDGFART